MSRGKLVSVVPLAEIRDLADALLTKGMKPEDVVDEIATLLDALVDWTVFLPAPAGALAEIVDGPLALALAKVIVRAVEKKRRKAA